VNGDLWFRGSSYRDGIRGLMEARPSAKVKDAIDALAQPIFPSSAIVFLVAESERTHRACRMIVAAVGKAQDALYSRDTGWSGEEWVELNNGLAELLREFQVAVRDELGVSGVDPSVILDRSTA
jgi:hypothetical protein